MLYFVNQANKEIIPGRPEKNCLFLKSIWCLNLQVLFFLYFLCLQKAFTLHSVKKAMNRAVLIQVGGILETVMFHYGNFRICSFV